SSEALPQLPPGCVWRTPQFTPQPVIIGAGANRETVTNGYGCTPPTDSLTVTKVVKPDPQNIGGTLSFPITVTCTNPAATYHLTVKGNSSTSVTLPAGSKCVTSETLPPPPPGWASPGLVDTGFMLLS